MRLKARVRRVTGLTVHSVGTIIDGEPVEVERMPPAAWVELVEEGEEQYFLYRYSASGDFAGDTWHETMEKAKAQAKAEYEIQESDWRPVVLLWDPEAIAKGPELKGRVQDVPDTAIRPGETNLEWVLRMLLRHLQTLAADTDTMRQAYPPECSAVDELVNDFSHYLECSRVLVEEGLVGEDYFEKSLLVGRKITDLSERHDPKYWTDEALRHRSEWIEIRRLAKEALAAMGYPLEPPPPRSM